jgi:hypothetical protein
MGSKLKIIAIIGVSFLCGCFATAWGAWRTYDWMLSKELHVEPSADIVTNIRIIQILQENDVARAIDVLEMGVDGDLIFLSALYADVGEGDIPPMAAQTLQLAREHRKQNPRLVKDPAIRASIDSVLKRGGAAAKEQDAPAQEPATKS